MMMTHEEILRLHQSGVIVIDPFEANLVSINSVDVRLGPDLWKLKKQQLRDVYRPSDDDWERIEPVTVAEIRHNYCHDTYAKGVLQPNDLCFVFQSGEFYLATTLEAIGTRPPKDPKDPYLVPKMHAKSTTGRQGLTVALCAGLGDVGYRSRFALEVRVTDNGDIPLAIGTPIAQVSFTAAAPTLLSYGGENRYQSEDGCAKFLPKAMKICRGS